MSDDDSVRERDADAADPPQSSTTQSRSASPSAAAARRARRIGGRPVTGDRAEATSEAAPSAVRMAKPTRNSAPDDSAPDDSAPDDATTDGGDGAAARIPRTVPSWLNWAPAAVMSAAAFVLAVLIVVYSYGVWWGPDAGRAPASATVNTARQRVLAAAKTCVAQTNTYQYQNLDAYEKSALGCATGEFASQLKRTIETLVKVNAPKLQAKQSAQINRGGVETVSSDGNQWTILLFGQLSVVNTTDPKGRTDPFAAQVIMERVRGIWLISQLRTVSTPLS